MRSEGGFIGDPETVRETRLEKQTEPLGSIGSVFLFREFWMPAKYTRA
jgi:hypothetical protein